MLSPLATRPRINPREEDEEDEEDDEEDEPERPKKREDDVDRRVDGASAAAADPEPVLGAADLDEDDTDEDEPEIIRLPLLLRDLKLERPTREDVAVAGLRELNNTGVV